MVASRTTAATLPRVCVGSVNRRIVSRFPTSGDPSHTDDGVGVRRIFHRLRSTAMENVNEHFKGIFDGHGQVPTKDLLATQCIFPSRIAALTPRLSLALSTTDGPATGDR